MGEPVEEFARIFAASSFPVKQKELTAGGWRLESTTVLRLLDKLRAAGKPLGEYVNGRFYYGIKTGLNEAFVVDRATRDALITEHPSSKEILKPFLRGRDVKRWSIQPRDLWLIFTRRGTNINKYPAIKKHLQKFKTQLIPGTPGGRKPGSYEWFEIQDNIAYWQEFERPKIVIPAIAQTTSYASDLSDYYSNDKTSICVTDSVNLVIGLLNSSVLWWFIKQTASTKQGGFYEFKPMYVTQLPIASTTAKQQAAIVKLVDQILAAKRADPHAETTELEREIDRLVYQLYDLTPDEIEAVEAGARGST